MPASRSKQISPSSAGLPGRRVQQGDPVSGHGPAHRTGPDRLARANCRRPGSSRSARSRPGWSPPSRAGPARSPPDSAARRRRPPPAAGSPAAVRSAWISIRQTVGGAQNVDDPCSRHHPHQRGRVEPGVVVAPAPSPRPARARTRWTRRVSPSPATRCSGARRRAAGRSSTSSTDARSDTRSGCAQPVWAAPWCRR